MISMVVKRIREDLLADTVERVFSEKGLSTTYLSRTLYNELGYSSPRLASIWIGNIKNGHIYGSTSTAPKSTDKSLDRLSYFLYVIGVEEDDGLISKLRETDNEFVYPPRNKVSIRRLEELTEKSEEIPLELLQNMLLETDPTEYMTVFRFLESRRKKKSD